MIVKMQIAESNSHGFRFVGSGLGFKNLHISQILWDANAAGLGSTPGEALAQYFKCMGSRIRLPLGSVLDPPLSTREDLFTPEPQLP